MCVVSAKRRLGLIYRQSKVESISPAPWLSITLKLNSCYQFVVQRLSITHRMSNKSSKEPYFLEKQFFDSQFAYHNADTVMSNHTSQGQVHKKI